MPSGRSRVVNSVRVWEGRLAFAATVAAFAWSAALILAAFLVPVYSGESVGVTSGVSGVTRAHFELTLVGANGIGVLIPVGIPAVLVALVWIALHRKCSRRD